MKKQFTLLLAVLLASLNFNASALVSTVLRVEPGCAAVLMEYSYTTYDYVFYQYLGEGDHQIEYDNYKNLYLRPAPGTETITVTPEDDYVSRSRAGMEQYTLYFGLHMQSLYTVTTTGTPSMPKTDIVLADGSHARVLEQNQRTYEYTLHQALTPGTTNSVPLAMDATDMPGTVPFYRICGDEGYILDQVTDANGNTVEIREDSYLGNYIEITAFTTLPLYNVTTKERPAPTGDPIFILSDGSHAYFTPFGGGGRTMLSPGENRVTVTESDIINVYPAEGHHFVSFTDNAGQSYTPGANGYVQLNGSYNFNPPYRITTEANAGSDPTVTLTIDNPEGIKCFFQSSSSNISLRAGENILTYSQNIAKEYLVIGRSQWDDYRSFYSVKANGVEQTPAYEYWIEVTDGMKIEVLVDYPEDESYTYTLEYADGAENFWTSIVVGSDEVKPVDNKFEAPAGASVQLYNHNATDWLIKEITVPAGRYTAITDPYSPISFTANGDGTIRVDAAPAQNLYITVNIVSGSDKIQVVNGNWNTGRDLVGLTEGANQVTIKDNCDYLLIRHVEENGIISSITYRESPDAELKPAVRSDYWPYYYTVSGLRNGAEVFITAGDVDYRNTCTVYVDQAGEELTFAAEAGRSFQLEDGYNTVIFNESENGANGFAIWGLPETSVLFCNGVKAESPFRVRFAQDGVYKLYTATPDPQPMAVSFNVCDGGYTVTDVTVDLSVPVADIATPFEVLPATRMTFRVTVPEGYENHVDANGDELENAEGLYSLDINQPTVITVGKEKTPGSITVTIADATADTDATWFDLAGRRIAARNLAPGLYIRVAAGRADKVAVK